MDTLRVGAAAFDITPGIDPTCGAWGCNPTITTVDQPLGGRCLALEHAGRRVVWLSFDLVGDSPRLTLQLRREVAEALDLPVEDLLWGTVQNHACGAPPWSRFTGATTADLSRTNPTYMDEQRNRFMRTCINAAGDALDQLQPARIYAGNGHCDSVSFNTRVFLPDGQVAYCRHHAESRHFDRPIDPTIGLLRFDDGAGHPIGALFNYNMHAATLINDHRISPDWIGTTRDMLEVALDGAPALYSQGFCADVNCYHLFGSPAQAHDTGARLGTAAVEALAHLNPARGTPLNLAHQTIEIQCQPMPTRPQFEQRIAAMEQFAEDLRRDPLLRFGCGMNLPEMVTGEARPALLGYRLDYLRHGLGLLDAGSPPRPTLDFTFSALRIGDVGAILAPGECFAETGLDLRQRSPFVHTLVCGDVNGLFGNIFTDADIEGNGCGIDSYYEIMALDGFRLPPAKGTEPRFRSEAVSLLESLL